MRLEVVVSAKQANPIYTGFPRNGQGKRDDSLDNSDGKDWITKVQCVAIEPPLKSTRNKTLQHKFSLLEQVLLFQQIMTK